MNRKGWVIDLRPEDSLVYAVMALLFGGGALSWGKIIVVPLLKDYIDNRKHQRMLAAKTGSELQTWLQDRIKELKDEQQDLKVQFKAQEDSCKAEREASRNERIRAETAMEGAESWRQQHEECQKQLSSLQTQMGELRRQVDNLQRRVDVAPSQGAEKPDMWGTSGK